MARGQRDDLLPSLRTVGYRGRATIALRDDTVSLAVTILGVFYGGQDFEAEIASTDQGDH